MVLCICGCTGEEVTTQNNAACLQKSFMESFSMVPGQCVTLQELPNKTFTLLKIDSAKKRKQWVPAATIAYSFKEENFSQEWYDITIDEDYQLEGTSFSGRFHITANDNDDGYVRYTIFVDDIEFTETETEYIFKKLTVRFSEYDPEY